MDFAEIIRDAEDRLFPNRALDVWERALYYHLIRRTHVDGLSGAVVSIDPLSKTSGMSTTKVREILRSLHDKGCIVIDERSRLGHVVRVHLPSDIVGPAAPQVQALVDLEAIDFFTGRKYVRELLEREGNRCFYCLRQLADDSCTLDHVMAQMNGVDNSYRNIVAACHECNTSKQGQSVTDFFRRLYRTGALSSAEFSERLTIVEQLQAGQFRPVVASNAV